MLQPELRMRLDAMKPAERRNQKQGEARREEKLSIRISKEDKYRFEYEATKRHMSLANYITESVKLAQCMYSLWESADKERQNGEEQSVSAP